MLEFNDYLAAQRAIKKAKEIQRSQLTNRFSLLDMETEQSRNAPIIASPAAVGYGPAVAMPTLTSMMPAMPSLEGVGEDETDTSLISTPKFSPMGKSPGASFNRDSTALDMSSFSSTNGVMPASIANIFQQEGEDTTTPHPRQPPPVLPKPSVYITLSGLYLQHNLPQYTLCYINKPLPLSMV